MSTKDHQSEPIESASETLQRIFDGHGSVLGSQMADESSRYDVLKKTDFPKPQRILLKRGKEASIALRNWSTPVQYVVAWPDSMSCPENVA